MTEQIAANTSSTRRRRGWLFVIAAALMLVLVGGGIVGFMWFTDYGSAMAHTISPLHDDKQLDRVIPNCFWVGMTREESRNTSFSIPMRLDERASAPDRVVGVISDQRTRFRPNPSPALRVEIDFEGDKAIATRWARFAEKW